MCYTAAISLHAFVINVLSSLVLYIYATYYDTDKDDKKTLQVSGIIIAWIGLMQLYDYIFWTNKRNRLNEITTKVAMVTNHLQPVVFYGLIRYFIGSLPSSLNVLIGIYGAVAIVYSLSVWNKLQYTEVTKKSSPSLYWAWNYAPGNKVLYPLYVLTLTFMSLRMLAAPYNWVFTVLFLSQYLFSHFKYHIMKSTGRFWCYFFSFTSLIFLGIVVGLKVFKT